MLILTTQNAQPRFTTHNRGNNKAIHVMSPRASLTYQTIRLLVKHRSHGSAADSLYSALIFALSRSLILALSRSLIFALSRSLSSYSLVANCPNSSFLARSAFPFARCKASARALR